MFLAGIASLIQITFLPGFLLLKLKGIKKQNLEKILYSFALSLIFNYMLLFILASIKLYTLPVLLVVFVLACTGLLILVLREDVVEKIQSLNAIFAALYIIIAAWLCNQFIFHSGSVFWGWDEIMSWSYWAGLWAGNSLPGINNNAYAQLIPANWSLTYVFIQTDKIAFFAKTIIPLFTFFIIISGFVLYKIMKKISYLIGTFILIPLVLTAWKDFPSITMGFVDIPLAFMVFLSLMILISASEAKTRKELIERLVFSAIFAGGAAVTKQPGLFIVALLPILAYLIVIKNSSLLTKKTKIVLVIAYFASIGLLVLPWYLYNELNLLKGVGLSGIFKQTAFSYINGSFYERVMHALPILAGSLGGRPGLIILTVLAAFSCLDKNIRWLVILVLLPFTLLFIVFASYEFRNFALCVPILGFSAGVGLYYLIKLTLKIINKTEWMDKLENLFKRIEERISIFPNLIGKSLKIPVIGILLLIAVIIGMNFYFTKSYLLKEQRNRSIAYLGDYREMNRALYNYLDKKQDYNGKILTHYIFLPFFPDIQAVYLNNFKLKDITNSMKQIDFRYVLMRNSILQNDTEISNWVVRQSQVSNIRKEFDEGGFLLYEVLKNAQTK